MSDKRKPSEPAAAAPTSKRARWDSDGFSPAVKEANGAAPAAASTDLAERAARLQVMRAKLAERLSQSKVSLSITFTHSHNGVYAGPPYITLITHTFTRTNQYTFSFCKAQLIYLSKPVQLGTTSRTRTFFMHRV